ncbi:MAG: LIC_10190 family membrane protein [Caldilineaceae bacterium]
MFSSEFLRFALTLSLWWFGCFLLFTGFGLLVFRLHGLKLRSYIEWLDCSWLGWSLLTFFLLLIHFFYRIDGWLFLGGALVTAWSLLRHRGELWSLIHQPQISTMLVAFLVLMITFWMTNRATGPAGRTDTLLYHLGMVQWNGSYPLVKGLANLHGRFGFNNSFLLLGAFFDVGLWQSKATHITNTFLVLLLLQQCVVYTIQLITPLFGFRRRTDHFTPSPKSWEPVTIFYTMLLPLCLLEVFNGNATSLSSDLPVTILSVVLGGQVLRFITQDHTALIVTGQRVLTQEDKFQLTMISLLICLGITIKISFVALGAALALLLILYLYQRALLQSLFTSFKFLLTLLGSLLIYLVVWMMRGVWLSGYPAYPLTLGGIPVPWQTPRSLVLSEALWIQSWARLPLAPWPEVVGNWRWLDSWLQTVPEEWRKLLLLTAIAVVVGLLLTVISRKSAATNRLSWFSLAPPLLSLFYWFFTAPSFRFATGSLWMLAIGALLLVIDRSRQMVKQLQRLLTVCLCGSLWWLLWPTDVVWWRPIDTAAILPPLTQPVITERYTTSQLLVAVPLPGEFLCWNYPQPCTPYFRQNLHAFAPQDLGQGFYLDDQFTYADMQQATLPVGITAPSEIGVMLVSDLIPKPDNDSYQPRPSLQLLVYSAQATSIDLTFTYRLPPGAAELALSAQLLIQSSETEQRLDLPATSNRSMVPFPLQRDFTIITIQPDKGWLQLLPEQNGASTAEAAVIISAIAIQQRVP